MNTVKASLRKYFAFAYKILRRNKKKFNPTAFNPLNSKPFGEYLTLSLLNFFKKCQFRLPLMRLISETDSRADRSILALLTACQECLKTSQVVRWLVLQMLTYVDCSSEMVKNSCVKIIAMAHNKN